MTATFLHDLFQDCPGSIELRHLPSRDRSFHGTSADAAAEAARLDRRGGAVYYGVATRDGKGGKKENIVAFPAVWADVDWKQTPKEMAENLLRDFPLRPTYIFASGGGLHLYWRFKEAVGKEEIVRIEAILRGIARILHADMASAEAAHVLRPPGMFNRKYDPPRRVEVIESNPEALYNLSDFDLYADAELPKTTTTPSTGTLLSADLLPNVVEQCAAVSRIISRAKQERHLGHSERIAVANLYSVFDGGGEQAVELFSTLSDYDAGFTSAQISSLVGKPPLCSNEALCGGEEKCVAINKAGGTSPIKLATWREEKKGPEIVVLEEMQAESARDLLSTPTPPADEVFAGLLAREEILTVAGRPKGGKSYFALQGGLSAAGGRDFLGFATPRPFKVLYVLAEGSKRRFKDRLANAIPFLPEVEDEDLDRLHVVDTRGRLKIDTEAGEKTLLRLAEPFDLIILDTLYALQGGGDENSHKDFRVISGALDRLKHSGDGKAVLLIHHVRKNPGEDAGADELRGAGFSAFSDAIVRLYKMKGRIGIHYELKFDLRNYEEREDILLTRMGPLFAPIDASSSRIDLQNYVVATITERGGRIEGRENLVKILIALTKMKRQTCINAITEAITAGRISSATMPGTNAKVYFLTDGNDDE
jgi:AAA domain